MSDRDLPRPGTRVRVLPGAWGTAADFVGQVVLVSSTMRADRWRDDIVYFLSTESYEAPLTRREWELVPVQE